MILAFIVIIFASIACCTSNIQSTPRVSIITTLSNNLEHLDKYIKNIERQTIFQACEFIFINKTTSENITQAMTCYCSKYANFRHVLANPETDIYTDINRIIHTAQAPYITIWDTNDRFVPDALEIQSHALDTHPQEMGVYADYYETNHAPDFFETIPPHADNIAIKTLPVFSLQNMRHHIPGPIVMWKKAIHKKCGFFNSLYKTEAAWEFWCRAVSHGMSLLKIERTLATCQRRSDHNTTAKKELMRVIKKQYHYLWKHIASTIPHHVQDITWSILICTLKSRASSFEKIFNKLRKQIQQSSLAHTIEIIFFIDDKEYTVGFKRNALLRASRGTYISFVDDDDDVHDRYIDLIYNKIKEEPDCISLKGIITVNDKDPRLFIHSIKYNRFFEKNRVYYRPPNHLNPIKRSIGIRYPFPEINFGEDSDWAMQMANDNALKKEAYIEEPYYFYKYDNKK